MQQSARRQYSLGSMARRSRTVLELEPLILHRGHQGRVAGGDASNDAGVRLLACGQQCSSAKRAGRLRRVCRGCGPKRQAEPSQPHTSARLWLTIHVQHLKGGAKVAEHLGKHAAHVGLRVDARGWGGG